MTSVPHTATLRPGIVGPGEPGHRVFESNFVIECTCGERLNVASMREQFAEETRARHLSDHERRGEYQDDPNFPLSDWQYEVANGDTRLGYDEWVAHRVEDWFDSPPDEHEFQAGAAAERQSERLREEWNP